MTQQIQFVYLTQAEYDALATKNPSVLYFTQDTYRIYKGESVYAARDFDQFNVTALSASAISVNGTPVSLEGHTHTMSQITDLGGFASESHTHNVGEIVGWSETDINFTNVNVSSLTVDGTEVSLEGHTHTMSQITDMGGFASEQHSHVVSDITDWETSDFQFNDILVSHLTVNGVAVSLEGHTHTFGQLSGQVDAKSQTIKNVQSPTNDTDAANKAYVDAAIQSAIGDILNTQF